MRQKTIKLFTIAELSPEVKKRVMEKSRYINVEDEFWSEGIIENWKEEIGKLGYEDIKILYSGFGSQGDGACFTASVNIKNWLKAHKLTSKYKALSKDNGEHFSYSITHNYRYYFATSTNVEQGFWDGSSLKAQSDAEAVLKLIEQERGKIGNKIYHELQDEYFAQLEDEAVCDTIEANEYEYLEDGTRFKN